MPSNILSRAVGDEEVLLDLNSQVYYGLNASGALIWRLLKKGTPLERIVGAVTTEFDVPPEKARQDILALLEHLKSKALLRAS